jgi:hypothetical protein
LTVKHAIDPTTVGPALKSTPHETIPSWKHNPTNSGRDGSQFPAGERRRGGKKRKTRRKHVGYDFCSSHFHHKHQYHGNGAKRTVKCDSFEKNDTEKKLKTKRWFNHFCSFGCRFNTMKDIQLQRLARNPPCYPTFFRFFLVVTSSTRPNTTKGGLITAQFHFNT